MIKGVALAIAVWIMVIALSGCATSRKKIATAPPQAAGMCRMFKLIEPSRMDVLTPETRNQINQHDVVWYKICQGRDILKEQAEAKAKANGK